MTKVTNTTHHKSINRRSVLKATGALVGAGAIGIAGQTVASEVSDDALLDKYIEAATISGMSLDLLVDMLHHLPNEAAIVSLEKLIAWATVKPPLKERAAHHYNAFAKVMNELAKEENADSWQIIAGASLIGGPVFRDAYQRVAFSAIQSETHSSVTMPVSRTVSSYGITRHTFGPLDVQGRCAHV